MTEPERTDGSGYARCLSICSDAFATHLGVRLVDVDRDRVVVRLPYHAAVGESRIHGGAICGLVDIAATAAFWADPDLDDTAWGATIDLSVHFLNLAVEEDLTAIATVRRRGGQISTGDVSVETGRGTEVAVARVTYKLSRVARSGKNAE